MKRGGSRRGFEPSPLVLKLALAPQKAAIQRALEAHGLLRHARLELEVEGVPGGPFITVVAWPEPPGHPRTIEVDVVRVGREVLEHPVTLSMPLERAVPAPVLITVDELDLDLDDERPRVIRLGDAVWHLVRQGGTAREIVRLDSRGRPVFQEVDTAVACYRLTCPRCGRARYARRNTIHQIQACWVCTRMARLRQKTLAQYRQRGPRRLARAVTTPGVIDRVLSLWDTGRYNATDIGRVMDLSNSHVTKILHRFGRRR